MRLPLIPHPTCSPAGLTLEVEAQQLRHGLQCLSADGRTLAGWQRYGTDPVSLLSTWELAQIERLLNAQTNKVAQ